jgi:hypothetical protein
MKQLMNLKKKNLNFRIRLLKILNSTYFLTTGLILVGVVILFVGLILLRVVFGTESPPSVWMNFIMVITCSFILTGSIFTIIRNEIPKDPNGILPSIKGRWAVVLGMFATLMSGFAEIGLLYFFLQDLFGK